MSRNNYHVPNLDRALQIIEELSRRPQGLTQKDLIGRLKVAKNSIYRITMTLVDDGILARDEESRRFFLTRKLMILGATAMGDQDLVDKAGPVMHELRDKVSLTVLLGVFEGAEGVVIEQAVGGSPYKFAVDLGTRFSFHASAPGKAYLAFLPGPKVEAILRRLPLTAYNDRTICTRQGLRAAFAKIRRVGYAVDWAEMYEGCHCVGTVIQDHRDMPIAAIWVTGPSISLPKSRFAKIGALVKEHAARISAKFGHGLKKGGAVR